MLQITTKKRKQNETHFADAYVRKRVQVRVRCGYMSTSFGKLRDFGASSMVFRHGSNVYLSFISVYMIVQKTVS